MVTRGNACIIVGQMGRVRKGLAPINPHLGRKEVTKWRHGVSGGWEGPDLINLT